MADEFQEALDRILPQILNFMPNVGSHGELATEKSPPF